MRRAILGSAAALLALALNVATAAVPPAGLVAEGEGRWTEALQIYRRHLATVADADLWVRVADIEARLKHPAEAAAALRRAADLRPDDAALHRRASQAAAAAGQASEALQSAERAHELEPQSIENLRAVAQLAAWAGDPWLSEHSYRELLRRDPGDSGSYLELARIDLRRGHLDQADRSYAAYRLLRPDDLSGWLEGATVHEFRGDYAAADALLREARRRFGRSERLAQAEAELLARSGRTTAALDVLPDLIEDDPDRYELHLLRTLALQGAGQGHSALDSLGELERLGPQRPETAGARLQVETPQRSSLAGRGSWYDDTVGITSVEGTLSAGLSPWANGRVTAGVTEWQLEAPSGSGFISADGQRRLAGQAASLTLEQRLAPWAGLRLGGGSFWADEHDSLPLYQAALDFRLRDTVDVELGRTHDVLMTSPRAASLGVERDLDQVRLRLRQGYVGTAELTASVSDHSDGNEAFELGLLQRMAVRRTERYNLDAGVRGQWLGYDRQLGNGYYDPEDFRRYQALGSAWIKLGDQAGIGLALALGLERDRALDENYEWGGDARLEGIAGAYGDWQLRGYASYGGRFDGTERLGAWRGTGAGLEITRRFGSLR